MGKVDTTLFTKIGNDLFVMQIYIDDIIFGSTNQDFCEFGKMMANEFEMSMTGELSYFLGLQIKQMRHICESRQVFQGHAQEVWNG